MPVFAETPTLDAADEAAIRAIVAGLEGSWNARDGEVYGSFFADNADFVIIDGTHIQGRAAIAAGHQRIFDTIYRESVNRGTILAVRPLAPQIAVAHVRWHLRFRIGGDEREGQTMNTLVLAREAESWQIAAFQNTMIDPALPRRLAGDGRAAAHG